MRFRQISRGLKNLVDRQGVHVVDEAREEDLSEGIRDLQPWSPDHVDEEVIGLSEGRDARLEAKFEKFEAIPAVHADCELSPEKLDERAHGIEELVLQDARVASGLLADDSVNLRLRQTVAVLHYIVLVRIRAHVRLRVHVAVPRLLDQAVHPEQQRLASQLDRALALLDREHPVVVLAERDVRDPPDPYGRLCQDRPQVQQVLLDRRLEHSVRG